MKRPQQVGTNLQTIPDAWPMDADHPLATGMRDLFIADEGCLMAKLDLKGADGWTIGAYMAKMGDRTMLDDLLAGIKPAQVIAHMLIHGPEVMRNVMYDRNAVKELSRTVPAESWQYFVSKVLIWGQCVTGDHEVLTPHGWRRFDQLGDNEPIATFNTNDRSIRWDRPEYVHRLPYKGDLLHFTGNSYDLLCTPDHRMPYKTNGTFKERTAQVIATAKGGDLAMSGTWAHGSRFKHARLLAAIMSDGHYPRIANTRLQFCFRKPRKIERIKRLLDEAKIEYRITTGIDKRDGKTQTYIYCLNAPIYPKRLHNGVLYWDIESMREFLDEYSYWDGSRKGPHRIHFAKDKEHLMWMATMARLCDQGFVLQTPQISGKGSLMQKLTLNNRSFASRASMTVNTVKDVDTTVYCVTVKSGYFLVRRNDKIMVTGNCYLMGPRLAAESVFVQSDGDVQFTERQAKEFRALVLERYRFTRYHEYFHNELSRQDYPARLQCPDGSIRTFWGRNRRDKCEILGEALAHVPQVVTTHFIKMALRRLWMDDENWPVGRPRSLSSRPRVEPLHTTHDDLLVQFKVEDLEWALAKLRTWFDNELLVAGQLIKIPFDGSYGTDWAMSRKLGKI